MGGTGKIITELKKLMLRHKIKIKLNVDIQNVNLENGRIISISDNNDNLYKCDRLIFNGDPPTFYKEILKTRKRKKFLPEFFTKYSMGMFVLFLEQLKNIQKLHIILYGWEKDLRVC